MNYIKYIIIFMVGMVVGRKSTRGRCLIHEVISANQQTDEDTDEQWGKFGDDGEFIPDYTYIGQEANDLMIKYAEEQYCYTCGTTADLHLMGQTPTIYLCGYCMTQATPDIKVADPELEALLDLEKRMHLVRKAYEWNYATTPQVPKAYISVEMSPGEIVEGCTVYNYRVNIDDPWVQFRLPFNCGHPYAGELVTRKLSLVQIPS